MASPVDTTVKHFNSTMVGAPVLNGIAGSLVSVLDACLVSGFDLKAVTSLVVVSGIATLTFAGSHSAVADSVVLVAGVTGTLIALNGEQKITAVGATTLKFATTLPDGTAAGTVTFKMASGNWAKPFFGTNLAVYKSADPLSTGMFLRVDDTSGANARVLGYETMSDVSTGTGFFPTATQIAGGGYWAKSTLSTVAPVRWDLFCDGRTFILSWVFSSAASSVIRSGRSVYVGDMQALKPGGDAYAFCLTCSSGAGNNGDGFVETGNTSGNFTPRSYTGLGSGISGFSYPYTGSNTTVSGIDSALGVFPSVVDGGLRLSGRYWSEAANTAPRANFVGLLTAPQSQLGLYFDPGVVVAGTGLLANKNLKAVGASNSAGASYPSVALGIAFVDITGPWR